MGGRISPCPERSLEAAIKERHRDPSSTVDRVTSPERERKRQSEQQRDGEEPDVEPSEPFSHRGEHGLDTEQVFV
jgi:hypothetical protein